MTDFDPPTGPPPVPSPHAQTFPVPPIPVQAIAVQTLRPRPALVRLLTEHNPFYLLSAACMLASCLALTNSLSWSSIAEDRLVRLILTLNVYEAALLGIALYLVKRRGLRRDGRMLLVLQFFFLADFTFLNAEITTADLRTGVIVNAGLFVLAAAKFIVVLRVLRPASFTPLQAGFALFQLAAVYGVPCALRWLDGPGGAVGPRHLYAVWWVAGLLPAGYELVARLDGRPNPLGPPAGDGPPGARFAAPTAAPTTAYLVLPYLSLLTHAGILHYVYKVDYVGADAAPMLLGLTLVLNRLSPTATVPRRDLVLLRLLLPLAAVLVSANDPFAFPLPFAYPRLTLTPFNLALTAAYLTYVYNFLRPHARLFLAAGAAAAAMYILGPSRHQVTGGARTAWDWTSRLADRLTPKTTADWGAVGLVTSFALLALGLWVSLRKRPDAGPP